MMLSLPRAVEVEIHRELSVAFVGYLEEHLASSQDGISYNLAYFDVRGWDARDVFDVIKEERELLGRVGSAGYTTEDAVSLLEEYFNDYSSLWGLDAGVGAAVLALSAAGATPISSCNGGTIGGDHHTSDVPHILFASSTDIDSEAIEYAISAAGLGLIANGPFAELYADQVLKFHRFAEALVGRLLHNQEN